MCAGVWGYDNRMSRDLCVSLEMMTGGVVGWAAAVVCHTDGGETSVWHSS